MNTHTPPPLTDMTWQEDAECTSWPAELWFAEGRTREVAADQRLAKDICDGCPVRRQCLELALAHESGSAFHRYGMFGGATPSERAKLAREAAA